MVTGASGGIGRAIACQLAAEGARVVVNYRQAAPDAEAVVAAIHEGGGEACAVQADVSDEAGVRQLVRASAKRFGRIDVLVANAGVVRDQLIGVMTLDQWETVIQTNLRGPFLCIREALPFMMRQQAGSIVCLSSVAADRGGRGHGNYVAAKGGLNAMVRSLALELAPKAIRVNAVSPGVIRTRCRSGSAARRRRDPRRDPAESDSASRRTSPGAVCFLASDDASYITGQILHVTGGFGL